MTDKKAPTHTAYTLKRETRTVSRYIEVGAARIDKHGEITTSTLTACPWEGSPGKFVLPP